MKDKKKNKKKKKNMYIPWLKQHGQTVVLKSSFQRASRPGDPARATSLFSRNKLSTNL